MIQCQCIKIDFKLGISDFFVTRKESPVTVAALFVTSVCDIDESYHVGKTA